MAIGWNFPSNNFGTVSGIGEAGIETFKGSPFRSLAREICQNSLDARMDDDTPVLVEFAYSELRTKDIPDGGALKEALNSCYDFWQKQNNKKTVDFFKKAVALMGKKTVRVLRISDFHTTGLTGSDKDYNTPWQNLVKASGVSDKGGTSGGSFGIGKSAPYACSDLRTVFYATRDKNGLSAGQGIAKLVSFPLKSGFLKKDTDHITTGIGYYGDTKKNSALKKCISLDDSFQRTEIGTDVYILGLSEKADWDRQIIASVLEDFLISIYEGRLIVRVQGVEISQKTLPQLAEEYKEQAEAAYNYYQSLVSPDAITVVENFAGLGDLELHVLIQEGLHRRVMMSRSNGMKVFDQKSISSSIHFAGVCVLWDEGINAYFREMENPQHDNWEPERHSHPSEARKLRKDLYHFIKNTIIDLGRKTALDVMDAEGVGEYLPDDVNEQTGKDTAESITDEAASIDLEVAQPQGVPQATAAQNKSESDTMPQDEYALDEQTDGGGESTEMDGRTSDDPVEPHDDRQSDPHDGSEPDGSGQLYGSGDWDKQKATVVETVSVRLFQIRAAMNRYRLIFTPAVSYQGGFLQFRLSGEQGNMQLPVSGAVLSRTGEPLETKKNKIKLGTVTAGQKMSVDFDVDYIGNCSMEVSLHGYKA